MNPQVNVNSDLAKRFLFHISKICRNHKHFQNLQRNKNFSHESNKAIEQMKERIKFLEKELLHVQGERDIAKIKNSLEIKKLINSINQIRLQIKDIK